MSTEFRRIQEEDFDILDSIGIPRPFRGGGPSCTTPRPFSGVRPSCTTPRPFRGGVRGGVNQKRSYPIMKYVVTVFISSTPDPSSQEEGNVDGVPSHPGGGL